MQLGAFSISLAVKDLEASRQFYEKFGFKRFGGDPSQNWLILKNGDTVIGLFQGMFDRNMLLARLPASARSSACRRCSLLSRKRRSASRVRVTSVAIEKNPTTRPSRMSGS